MQHISNPGQLDSRQGHIISAIIFEVIWFYFAFFSLHESFIPNALGRGGWTRAELHHGSMLQYASVYTISHAVRTSGEAIEDPLKLEFLSSFRCNCWMLNVILLHNSSDYLTNTRRSMKTIKTRVFLRSTPRVKTSSRVIDQSYWRRWIYVAISSIYPATFKRLSKRKWLCFPSNAALRLYIQQTKAWMRLLLCYCLHFCTVFFY